MCISSSRSPRLSLKDVDDVLLIRVLRKDARFRARRYKNNSCNSITGFVRQYYGIYNDDGKRKSGSTCMSRRMFMKSMISHSHSLCSNRKGTPSRAPCTFRSCWCARWLSFIRCRVHARVAALCPHGKSDPLRLITTLPTPEDSEG